MKDQKQFVKALNALCEAAAWCSVVHTENHLRSDEKLKKEVSEEVQKAKTKLLELFNSAS